MKHIGKMRVGELRCRQSENKSKFQVITISQSTEIVDIALQIMIVGRCVNWVVKQNVVCIRDIVPSDKEIMVMSLT